MPFSNRFSIIDKAMLITTGNTFSLCGDATAPIINTADLVTPSGEITRDWTNCGSEAILNIKTDSTILYAELTWYSTVKSSDPSAIDYRTIQDDPITFITPTGEITITPAYAESYTEPSGSINRFRTADVTTIVKTSLSGTYTVSKVPTSIPPTGLSDTNGSWILSVIYTHESFIPKRIEYGSGIQNVSSSTPFQKSYVGFTTTENQKNGYLLISAADGSPIITGDIVKGGSSFASLANLGNVVGVGHPNPGTWPNNPNNNFFAGQINVSDPENSNFGLINITGTMGTDNHDAFVPIQVIGARNKFDLAGISLANVLSQNQTQLAVQIETTNTNSNVQLLAMGCIVPVVAPNITTDFSIFDADAEDLKDVEVGETLIYRLQIRNTGTSDAENMTISTIINPSCSFIPDSFKLNGVPVPDVDIETGVNIGTIEAFGVDTIIFGVQVNSMPPDQMITAQMSYTYQFTSGSGSPVYTNTAKTKTESLLVLDGRLSAVKTCSVVSASVNDIITYTTTVSNVGVLPVTDLLFQDVISPYSSFIKGSVYVDDVNYPDYDPNIGFSLPDLDAGGACVVNFNTQIMDVPTSASMDNQSVVTYQYIYSDYLTPRIVSFYSNTISTQINFFEIIGERCNDNEYPEVGDTVTYRLALTNIGNVGSGPVLVKEPVIDGASFIVESVTVNGVPQPTSNPFTGFEVPSILPQQTTEVTYQVLINQIPAKELIENIANVPFKYRISPADPVIDVTVDSNKVVTRSNFVTIDVHETVDKAYATINDVLYYLVTFKNTGNIEAYDTIFSSIIQSGSEFIKNSVTINGMPQAGYDPNVGFSVGVICPGDTLTVGFKARVISIPAPNTLYNTSVLLFSYLPDPEHAHLTDTVISNTVQTELNVASFTLAKTVDKVYAVIGDLLVYKSVVHNTGTVPLTNVFFLDNVISFLQFNKGTVYVAGVPYAGYDPTKGFYIGDIAPSASVDIIFSATIAALPPSGYVPDKSCITYTYQTNPDSPVIRTTNYSNTVTTDVVKGELSAVKSVNADYAKVEDILTYTVKVTNTGNVIAHNVTFTDIVPGGATFNPGTVSINGQSKPNYNPNAGFPIGLLNPGQVVTVKFSATVTSVLVPNTLINRANLNFEYYIVPTDQPISKTIFSNSVTTIVNDSSSTIVKAVDKTYATVNDVLNYSVVVHNTGTVPLNSINFTDLIPTGATFNIGSVYINGVNQPTYNPNNSFTLGTIDAGGSSTVVFSATVTSVPNPPTINNRSAVTYQYQLIPTSPPITVTKTSNTVTTNVKSIAVSNTKSASQQYATVGDTVTYTSVIQTTGNTDLLNTFFTDAVAAHTRFVDGTVQIGGQSFPDYDPNVGFALGSILPNTPVNVTFDVTVESVPPSGKVQNTSNVLYEYYIDPTKPPISKNTGSNTITLTINAGSLTITKTADREYARVTDTINYGFVIANTGNVSLTDLNLTDIIQTESQFVSGSVSINGVIIPQVDPNTGIPIGTLDVGQYCTVKFQVQVMSVPPSDNLLNKGNLSYSYKIDPGGQKITKSMDSNTTTVRVNAAIVSINKTVDKSIAKLTDTLLFSVTLQNGGSVPAQSVFFKDIVDSHLLFVPDSVYIDDVNIPGLDPNVGFDLADILTGVTTTVAFSATIQTRPANNIVYNTATTTYEYEEQQGQPLVQVDISSNTTETYVAIGELTADKKVDKVYATLADTLTYTVKVTNTGSVNAVNVNFKDLVPPSASFVEQSVVIDGVPQPTYNPNDGFALSDLVPLQFHTVTFKAIADSVPTSGEIDNTASVTFDYRLLPTDPITTMTIYSNTVITYINYGKLTISKAADKQYATIGDTILYTSTISNIGNVKCSNINFNDIVQSDAVFNPKSVYINDINMQTYDPNVGFSIPDMEKGQTVTVKFTVTVQTVPTGGILYNSATINYQYYINPAEIAIQAQSNSNTVQTIINVGQLTLTKTVDKLYATIGDVLLYTVNVANSGTVTATTINFRDIIQTGASFILDSVTIDGVPKPGYDPYESFALANLAAGNTTEVTFKVLVTSIPPLALLNNNATATFTYYIDPHGSGFTEQSTSNTVTTTIYVGLLTLTKTADKGYVAVGGDLVYSLHLTNSGNVDLTDVIFIDNLQPDISFKTGSVIIDGVPYPDYDPIIGVPIGTIKTLETVNVVFTAEVKQDSMSDKVVNYGIGTYSYKIDPGGQSYTTSAVSNSVTTIIVRYGMTATKTVDLGYATINDILNYKIVVKNTGNTTNFELQFTDILSDGAAFVPESVTINDVSYPSYDPIAGFPLSDLLAGATATVRFQTIVTAVPATMIVSNYADVNGYYRVGPAGQPISVAVASNTVQTIIHVGNITDVKTVNKAYGQVGDVLTYTSVLTNTGNVNTTDVQFFDDLQDKIQFVSGTVRINGIYNPSLDPQKGFMLGTLTPTQNVTIDFDAKIMELPTPPIASNQSQCEFSYLIDPKGSTITKTIMSNTVTTNVVLSQLNVNKLVDKTLATVGDVLTYTVKITNAGNVAANNVMFYDTPSTGATFLAGSVTVNGESKPLLNPTTGFGLDDIGVGMVTTVVFKATVTSVPPAGIVTNQATIQYKYFIDPKQPPVSQTTYSNVTTTSIAKGELTVVKSVDKKYATIGENLTYTIVITNVGNVDATNIIFLDATPQNAMFVLGSVIVNGISQPGYNPAAGFALNTLKSGEIDTIVYLVQVIS